VEAVTTVPTTENLRVCLSTDGPRFRKYSLIPIFSFPPFYTLSYVRTVTLPLPLFPGFRFVRTYRYVTVTDVTDLTRYRTVPGSRVTRGPGVTGFPGTRLPPVTRLTGPVNGSRGTGYRVRV